MKRYIPVFFLLAFFMAGPAHALLIWHTQTLWVNQGYCVAAFKFDSEDEEYIDLQISVTLVDAEGNRVSSEVMHVDTFGNCSAARYTSAGIESQEICDSNLTVVVNKATAIVNGRRTKVSIFPREEKPMRIVIDQ